MTNLFDFWEIEVYHDNCFKCKVLQLYCMQNCIQSRKFNGIFSTIWMWIVADSTTSCNFVTCYTGNGSMLHTSLNSFFIEEFMNQNTDLNWIELRFFVFFEIMYGLRIFFSIQKYFLVVCSNTLKYSIRSFEYSYITIHYI